VSAAPRGVTTPRRSTLRSAFAYLASALCGGIVALVWALSVPDVRESWDWATPVLRILVGVPAAMALAVAFDVATRRFGRALDRRARARESRAPGAAATALGGAALTVAVCGPAALGAIAALLRGAGPRTGDLAPAALVVSAVAALPLGLRVGRAIWRSRETHTHHAFRLARKHDA
jgi:hypothetical protein